MKTQRKENPETGSMGKKRNRRPPPQLIKQLLAWLRPRPLALPETRGRERHIYMNGIWVGLTAVFVSRRHFY